VKQWWKRHTVGLAIVFAAVSLLLGSAVAVQAVMLHAQGWRLQWGDVPGWISGVSTAAAFVALGFTAREWWTARGDQARLIIVEPAGEDELEPWGLEPDEAHRKCSVLIGESAHL
jgi:hypothetical protein